MDPDEGALWTLDARIAEAFGTAVAILLALPRAHPEDDWNRGAGKAGQQPVSLERQPRLYWRERAFDGSRRGCAQRIRASQCISALRDVVHRSLYGAPGAFHRILIRIPGYE